MRPRGDGRMARCRMRRCMRHTSGERFSDCTRRSARLTLRVASAPAALPAAPPRAGRVQRRVLHICMPRYPLQPGRSPAGPSSRAARSRTRATTSRRRRSARVDRRSAHTLYLSNVHTRNRGAHAGRQRSAASGLRPLHPPPAQPGRRDVLARAAGDVRQHAWVGVSPRSRTGTFGGDAAARAGALADGSAERGRSLAAARCGFGESLWRAPTIAARSGGLGT